MRPQLALLFLLAAIACTARQAGARDAFDRGDPGTGPWVAELLDTGNLGDFDDGEVGLDLPLAELSLDRHAFAFSLTGAVARNDGPRGVVIRTRIELALHVPFARLFGGARPSMARAHASARTRPLPALPDEKRTTPLHQSPLFLRSSEDPMTHALLPLPRRATLPPYVLAIPTAIAFAPAALADPPRINAGAARPSTSIRASVSAPSASVAPSSSTSTRASTAPSASASSVGAAPAQPPALRLRALTHAAVSAAGIADDEPLGELAARARRSALMPELRVRAMHSTVDGTKVSTSASATYDPTSVLSDGNTLLFEGRLLFRLDRLVFADEEVALERLRIERIELRDRLVSRVVELYLRWLRAKRAANDAVASALEREEADVVATEAALALDALTGGAAKRILAADR